jgi:hypothetical protein
MIFDPVGAVGFARLAEADEVRRNAMGDRRDERDNVSPYVGRGGIAVQEERDRRVARAGLPVTAVRYEKCLLRRTALILLVS